MRYKRIQYLNDDDLLIKLKDGIIKAYASIESVGLGEFIFTVKRSSIDAIDNGSYVDIIGQITGYSIYLKKFIANKSDQILFIRKNENNYILLG